MGYPRIPGSPLTPSLSIGSRRFGGFLLAFQGKTITKCIFGLNWAVSTLFTFTEFVYNFRFFLIIWGKKSFFKKRNWLLWNQTLTVLAKILMCYTYILKKTFVLKTFDSLFCVLYMIWFFFFFAAGNGHKDVVQLLLDNNANIDQQRPNGFTALMYAGK